MNVQRAVIRDLMTVVYAGEASAESRALVEEYLAQDPELAVEAKALRSALTLPASPEPGGGIRPADLRTVEKQTLDTTRQLLKQRSATFAVGLLFSLLPLSFVFEGSRVTFLLIRDAPVIGIAWWVTAAAMWVWHISLRRRLKVSGL